MRSDRFLAAILGTLVACGGRSAPDARDPGAGASRELSPLSVTQTRVFTGADGLTVEVVELEGGDALVRVTGVRSALSGKALRVHTQEDDRYLYYRYTWHGRERGLLVREALRDGNTVWWLYLPDVAGDGLGITYSDERSPALDVASVHRAHVEQSERGELDAIARFDRAAEEAEENEALASAAARTGQACGRTVPVNVAWSTVSDEQLKQYSVSGYCSSLLSALHDACSYEAGRTLVAAVKQTTCSLAGGDALRLQGGELLWAIGFDSVNLDEKARTALHDLVPPGDSVSLGERIQGEDTDVCTDKEGEHVVVIGPREAPHGGLAYGEGKTLVRVPVPELLSGGWFFDPRQKNEGNNSALRGYDLRFFSHVDVDREQGTCVLTCGTRRIDLKLLSGDGKRDALAGVSYQPSPHDRVPYALARDTQGTYYYVDRGALPGQERDFRLYRGKRGRLAALAMRDVVSDSEGEVFASDSGKLRFIVGRDEAQWIGPDRSSKLLVVPLAQNYGLIYNELGVYLGDRLGVPCDDL